MPRNLSFALTEPQFMNGSKDVTRRVGWRFLRRGDVLCGVRKAMGLKSAETVVRLGLIEVAEVWSEPLNTILMDETYGRSECRREGFPEMTPAEFVAFFVRTHRGLSPSTHVTRIAFKHLPDAPELPVTLWSSSNHKSRSSD